MNDIDPNCLCGQPHPCPTHGQRAGQPPLAPRAAPNDHLTVAQRRAQDEVRPMADRTRWILMKEMAARRPHTTHLHESEGAA